MFLEAGAVYPLTLIFSRKSDGDNAVGFVSHYLKVRFPEIDGNEYQPFESAFSIYQGYHSIGSPFAPQSLPGPLCAATSSLRGSQLSFRKWKLICFCCSLQLIHTSRNRWSPCKFHLVRSWCVWSSQYSGGPIPVRIVEGGVHSILWIIKNPWVGTKSSQWWWIICSFICSYCCRIICH